MKLYLYMYVCTVVHLKYFHTSLCYETEICPLVPTRLGETDSHLATESGRYLQALNIDVHVHMYSCIKSLIQSAATECYWQLYT